MTITEAIIALSKYIELNDPLLDRTELEDFEKSRENINAAISLGLTALYEKQGRENPTPLSLEQLLGLLNKPVYLTTWDDDHYGESWEILRSIQFEENVPILVFRGGLKLKYEECHTYNYKII